MSEVDVEPSELLGIPGYALNVTVPGEFELPVPSVPAGTSRGRDRWCSQCRMLLCGRTSMGPR